MRPPRVDLDLVFIGIAVQKSCEQILLAQHRDLPRVQKSLAFQIDHVGTDDCADPPAYDVVRDVRYQHASCFHAGGRAQYFVIPSLPLFFNCHFVHDQCML